MSEVKSDIAIARAAKKIHIREVAAKINIPEDNLIQYGHDAAKIDFPFIEKSKSNKNGKLILVTAISPTPAGEGKTTTSVGLSDGLNKIGKIYCCIKRTKFRSLFWNEGWSCWWWLCSSCTYGRN